MQEEYFLSDRPTAEEFRKKFLEMLNDKGFLPDDV